MDGEKLIKVFRAAFESSIYVKFIYIAQHLCMFCIVEKAIIKFSLSLINKNGSPMLVLIFVNSKATCDYLINFGRGGEQMIGHDEHCVELINHSLSKSIHRLSSILNE